MKRSTVACSMADYKPGDGKMPTPTERGGWIVHKFLGQPAYTDGHLVLIGTPPSNETSAWSPSPEKVEAVLPRKTKKLEPLRFEPRQRAGWPDYVWFRDLIYPIQALFYDHVLSRYPNATFRAPLRGNPNLPIAIESGGKIVGAVMAVRI